jgi:hypothetical protein
MASTVSLDGVKKAVYFPFQGKNWGIKILVGSVLLFISGFIIPIIPVFGYFAQIMKKVLVQEEDPEMPEWEDWGTLFSDGIKLFGVLLIYLLPAILLIVIGYLLFMVLDFSFVFMAPAYAQSSSDILPTSMIGSFLGMFGGMAVFMLGFFLAFITMLITPPALGNLIAKGDFGAAFRIKEWWPVLKANLAGYLLAIAIAMGLFYLLYLLSFIIYATVVLCFLLPFALAFTFFVSGAVSFSVYSVAYRDGERKLAEAK